MAKRTFKEIRNQILKELKKVKVCSYSYLERKINTNWQTVRDHVENLQFFGVAEITKDNKIKMTSSAP